MVALHHHRLCVQGHPPPQDFWNRAVVAKEPLTIEYIEAARLKISGIAPWSPLPLAVRFPRMFRLKISGIAPWSPMRTGWKIKGQSPPQDFWNRAVVAKFKTGWQEMPTARLKISGIAPWSPLGVVAAILGRRHRLKISGIAPWSPGGGRKRPGL